MKKEYTINDWNKPIVGLSLVILLALLALVVYYFTFPKAPGCFTFDDGTAQNWTLMQFYETDSIPAIYDESSTYKKIMHVTAGNPPKTNAFLPYILANHQNIALEANTGASGYGIENQNVERADIFFKSPDLSNNLNWQNLKGFSVDVTRVLGTNITSGTPELYNAQLLMWVIDLSDNKEYLLTQPDISNPGNYKFYNLKPKAADLLEWKWGNKLKIGKKMLNSSEYKIKNVKIRYTMPGYINAGASFQSAIMSGYWRIGNVCPIK